MRKKVKKRPASPEGTGRHNDWARGALTLAVVLTVLHLAYVNIRSDAFARTILPPTFGGAAPREIAMYAEIDRLFEAITAKGNVLLRVQPGPNRASAEQFAEMVYYRAVYAIYPRRVYGGRASDVINNGQELLNVSFSPDERWLDEHRVATTITFRVDERGAFAYALEERVPRERGSPPARRP
jgi:hypothetical protein